MIDALLLFALPAAASSTTHQGGLSAVDLALGSRPVNRHLVDLLLDFDAAAAYGTTTEVAQVGCCVCVSATWLVYRLVHPVRAGSYRSV